LVPFDLVHAATAAASPPFDAAAVPEAVVLTGARARLRISWDDGAKAELEANRLRAACRCAWCTRARLDGNFPGTFDGVIGGLAQIGGYALNIAFSDGHARGIYPWTYLRHIAQAKDVEGSPA
jgi:prepilin-type processing-associated H-X9-DG protein